MRRFSRIALIAVGSILPLLFYFWQFHGSLVQDHLRWSEFGSYLSGVYGTLALIIVGYSTYLTRRQFKTQSEDSVFFKLFELLQNRIENSQISINEEVFTAQRSLKVIAERFQVELSNQCIEIARMLLCEEPENVAYVHYAKLFEAINGADYLETFAEDRDAFIQDIVAQGDFNDRWERLKDYIGSRGQEGSKIREALRATGSVNFYRIPFSKRQSYYVQALGNIMHD